MKNVLSIIFILFLFCCSNSNNTKKDEFNKTSNLKLDSLTVYNDIINNMVKNYYYDNYLGKEGKLLNTRFLKKEIDSVIYDLKKKEIEEKIINNDSLKGTLYINKEPTKRDIEINKLNLPNDINLPNINQVNRSINTQFKLSVNSLKSNLMRIKSLELSDKLGDKFVIGNMSLSELYFNEDQSYGLVYIEFVCVESHCGQADVVLFRRIGKSYKVAQVFSLWEI